MIKIEKPQAFDSGRFFLLGPVGRGGSGEVYRAKQAGLDRTVAIKVLASDLDDEEAKGLALRLKDEAMAASKVRHPGLVEVIDAGIDDQLGPYVAYEYLDGGTLEDWLGQQGPMDAKDVYLKFGKTMLNALSTLHNAGIVHRDIKPENLVADSRGVFKLTDLGLANFQGRQVRTKTGMVWGTPGYMAPERLKTPPPPAHPKQDIYAAAMLFVRAISGRLPFKSKTLGAMVKEQLDNDISAENLLSLSIEPPLAKVLAKALHRSPKHRTSDAKTLKKEIAKAINAPKTAKLKPTKAARAPSTVSVKPYVKRGKSPTVIGVLLVTAVATLAIAYSAFAPKAQTSGQHEVRLQRLAKNMLSSANALTSEDYARIGSLAQKNNEEKGFAPEILGLKLLANLAATRKIPSKACTLYLKLARRLNLQQNNSLVFKSISDKWVASAVSARKESELIEFAHGINDIADKITIGKSLFDYSLASVRQGRQDSIKERCLTVAKWMMAIDDAMCSEEQKLLYRQLIIDSLALPDGDECRKLHYKWLNRKNAFDIAQRDRRRGLFLLAAQGTALSLVPSLQDQNRALDLVEQAKDLSRGAIEMCEVLALQTILELVIRPNELTTSKEQSEKAYATIDKARALDTPKAWQNLIRSIAAMAAIAGPSFLPKKAQKLMKSMKAEDVPRKWEWWYWRVYSAIARSQGKRKEAVKRYQKTQSIAPATVMFYVITRKQNTDLMSLPSAVFR